jgi:hypothetical protein
MTCQIFPLVKERVHIQPGNIITDYRLDNNLEFGFLSFLARGQHDSFDSATAL